MKKGIMICGLNGSGKSTLGSALAESLGYFFIDNEDLFFPKTDPNYLFASPRSREEAIRLLAEAVQAHPYFVFSAVRGDYGEIVPKLYRCVIRRGGTQRNSAAKSAAPILREVRCTYAPGGRLARAGIRFLCHGRRQD